MEVLKGHEEEDSAENLDTLLPKPPPFWGRHFFLTRFDLYAAKKVSRKPVWLE